MLHRLVQRLDIQSERWGWDLPPRLLVISDERDTVGSSEYRRLLPGGGSSCSAGPYVARQLLPDFMFARTSASVAVRRLALRFINPDPIAQIATGLMLQLLRQPGFVGLCLVAEAWLRQMTQPEVEQYQVGDQRLVDMAGTREARMINVVDVDDVSHYLVRVRHEAPQDVVVDQPSHEGALVDSLRTLVAVVDQRTPRPMEYEPIGGP
jgi:hypothetical protein